MITVNTVHVYKILIFNTYWLQFHNFRGKQLNSSKFEGFMGFFTGGCRKLKSQSFNILAISVNKLKRTIYLFQLK